MALMMLASGCHAALLTAHTSRYASASRTRQRSAAPLAKVPELDGDSFCSSIGGVPRMAVVEFYAPWCRTCKAAAPAFDRIANKFSSEVDFFK